MSFAGKYKLILRRESSSSRLGEVLAESAAVTATWPEIILTLPQNHEGKFLIVTAALTLPINHKGRFLVVRGRGWLRVRRKTRLLHFKPTRSIFIKLNTFFSPFHNSALTEDVTIRFDSPTLKCGPIKSKKKIWLSLVYHHDNRTRMNIADQAWKPEIKTSKEIAQVGFWYFFFGGVKSTLCRRF